MMDPAYFVGKNELLLWLNELLKLNYSKVEQCNTGAAYCQIIDAVYPVTICPANK
jgi:microtubule-associated protein, RP/EB family